MQTQCADVLVHIDEVLSDDDIHRLEADLREIQGVRSACVNDRARHLMLIDYDPADIESEYLLRQVKEHGLHAELIGL